MRPLQETPDYATITESPGNRATGDQMRILYTRYGMAAGYAEGKTVLEVACGTGVGLGYLARRAQRVVGGDITPANCRIAAETYRNHPKVAVGRLDAQALPFPDASFDVVVLFEALYYIPDANRFFREARRVIRPGGALLISTVNCEWGGFNTSPFSTKYFTAGELLRTMTSHGFDSNLRAGFPEPTNGPRTLLTSCIRRAAVHLRLIPKTMKQKEWLKRLFYGRLMPIPRELPEDPAPLPPLREISDRDDAKQYRMLYAIGHRS